ncbi:MAG: PAS domain S-box protein, partial [Candidatus Marinimicrobia bacterium]|nr:PAS domain S-box protein [Candidatus Neomarinimicrobiota bacterium]
MKIRIKYINAMILSFIKNILNSFDSESQEFRILIYQTNINRARIFFSIIFLLLTPLLHFDYQRIQNITDNNLLGAELLFYAHIGMTIVSLLIVLFCLTIYSKLREYNEIGKHFFYVLLFTILNLSAIVTLGDIILGVGISNYIGTIMLFSFVLYLTPLLSGIFYLGNSTILFFLTISLNIIDGHQKQSILINLILYGVLAFFASLYFFNLKKRDYQLHKDMEESEQLYKDIFNISPDPMVIHDGEKILQTNLATLQATGIKDINDIIGSDPMRFLHPDDRKKGRERSKIMLKTSSSLGADEFVFIGPENKNLTVIVRPRLIKYNNKNAILVHYHDITVQKNREKELAESNKSSIILNDILKSVNSSATIDELYNSVHTSLNEIIDARNFFIAILTDDRTKVIFPYYRDDYDKWMETEGNRREVNMSDHNSMTARLMQNKQPVLWHKSEIIEQFGYDDSSEYGSLPDQWLGVPLKIQELLIGCLVVQIYKNENPYTQNDLLFMESVADTIAPAFERIIAETAINESRKKYKDLFEKSADANLIIENGLFIDCNQAALDMLGITSKIGLLPIRPQEISPETQPDGQNSLIKSNEMIQIALDQGSNRFEWEHIRKNG